MGVRLCILILLITRTGYPQLWNDPLETADSDLDPQVLEELYTAKETVKINRMDSAELVRTGLFSPELSGIIVQYREVNGKISSLSELQRILNVNQEQLIWFQEILDFENLSTGIRRTKSYLVFRLEGTAEPTRGLRENNFMGAGLRRLVRFRSVKSGTYSTGFLLESDRGEPLVHEKNLFEFQSFHYFNFEPSKRIKWVVGDFRFQNGEGLLFSNGLRPVKNPVYLSRIKSSSDGIKPYTGSMEYGFLRGAGVSVNLSTNLDTDVFISTKREDATHYEGGFRSVRKTGLSRSEREWENRKTVAFTVGGIRLSHTGSSHSLRILTVLTKLDQPRIEQWSQTDSYQPYGSEFKWVSIGAEKQIRNIKYFSEVAFALGWGYSSLQGLLLNLHKNIYSTIIHRYYSPGYFSFWANGFGEYSGTSNESGYYSGIVFLPDSDLRISAYFDVFRKLVPEDNLPVSGWGSEKQFSLEWELPSDGNLRFRWKVENKSESLKDNVIPKAWVNQLQRIQLRLTQPVSSNAELRCYLQGSVGKENKNGRFLGAEMIKNRKGWRISGRVAGFYTDDFETRQFIYERDLEYSFSIPSFQGAGVRWYLMARWKRNDWTFWMRISRTSWSDREKISSGWEEIEGNKKTELKLQLRYSWNR